MRRKAALVGCPRGQWVRTQEMRKLQLNARVRPDTLIRVVQRTLQEESERMIVGPGVHALAEAHWTKLEIAEGSHLDALCLLESA